MTVGSLFAGIGGFDLGFEWAGFDVKWQVEKDWFARHILAQQWPDVALFNDVREVGAEQLEWVDVICGGFPCQDISVANTSDTGATGLDGDRSGLWREFARIIGELRPRYVVVENSPALAIRGLDRVLIDLAEVGMDAVWRTVRASQFGARHRRERMLICAYANSDGLQGRGRGYQPDLAVPPLGDGVDWPTLSAPFGCRGSDGIPLRVDRTRSLGNAVVPQVSAWVARRILAAEAERRTA